MEPSQQSLLMPECMSIPIEKYSHSSSSPASTSYQWTHERKRDDLFLVFRNVRMQASGLNSDRECLMMSISAGGNILVWSQNLCPETTQRKITLSRSPSNLYCRTGTARRWQASWNDSKVRLDVTDHGVEHCKYWSARADSSQEALHCNEIHEGSYQGRLPLQIRLQHAWYPESFVCIFLSDEANICDLLDSTYPGEVQAWSRL